MYLRYLVYANIPSGNLNWYFWYENIPYFQFERRGRSEEKRSSWQPYRVALSDEASPKSDLDVEEDDDDDAVYGKQVKFTYGGSGNKDSKWNGKKTSKSGWSRGPML
jgi:hypothetical protein